MTIKVTVLGTRGIPDVQGGVETHCQNLYPEIYRQGSTDICVIARSPYVNYRRSEYQGVKLKSLWAPKSRSGGAVASLSGKTRRFYPSWSRLRSTEMGPDGQRDAAPWRKMGGEIRQ